MTIPAGYAPSTYNGNGVTVSFALPQLTEDTDDVVVTLTNAAGVNTIQSAYTVAGIGDPDGITVTMTTAPATGETLTIALDPVTEQQTHFLPLGIFPSENTENALDRLTRIAQIHRQKIDRSIRAPDTDDVLRELPTATVRASRFPIFDSLGDLTTSSGTGADSGLRQDLADGDPLLVGYTAIKYDRIAAEISAGVTPTFYFYAPSPKIDVRRYLTAWDDGSTQTTGLQAAINMSYAQKGELVLPNGLNVKSAALTLTMPGNQYTQGLTISGPGGNGATITQAAVGSNIFTFSGPTPSGDPANSRLTLEGFTVAGITSSSGTGIKLDGLASWTIRGMLIHSFATNVHLSSALTGLIEDCSIETAYSYGILAQRNGAGSGCNNNKIKDSRINLNAVNGIYLASGSGWSLENNDIEGNGTTAVLTTGGLRILDTIDDEFGFAIVTISNQHFESNLGQPMMVDSTSGLTLSMKSCLMVSGEGNRELKVSGANMVSIEDCVNGTSDVFDITANKAHIKNSVISVLIDTGVVQPVYENVVTATTQHPFGRVDSYTGTLTGCTTSPTATVTVIEQGDEVTLRFVSLTATSNTTACTVTGMPARYRPSGTLVIQVAFTDNGTDSVRGATLSSAGVIDFGTTANVGTKGVRGGTATYRLA